MLIAASPCVVLAVYDLYFTLPGRLGRSSDFFAIAGTTPWSCHAGQSQAEHPLTANEQLRNARVLRRQRACSR